MQDKSYLVRQLVPKSFHFDGYDMVNCRNRRDKPLFEDDVIPMGTHYLTTHLEGKDNLSIEFSSICPVGEITFKPYYITVDEFALKLKKMMQDGCDFITLEIQIQSPHYHAPSCRTCFSMNPDCSKLRSTSVIDPVIAAISFHTKHVEKALAAYYEITNTIGKGDIIMRNYGGNKKNLFGLNFELGISKDPNIAATLMGVAVKDTSSGNWYTFDQASNTRRNLANLKMGNFPIFLLPTKILAVGDLVKMNGKYFYVKSLSAHNTVTLIGATDGIIQEMLPEESIIPGMTLYTKVVAFDTKTLTDTSSQQSMGSNVLAAMLMMQWAKGNSSNAEFSLDNINDDSFNGLGSLWPILAMSGHNISGIGGIFTSPDGSINLPMLMMLGSGSSEESDMMQMLVLSHLLGNTGSLAANPLTDVISQLPISGAVSNSATNEVKVCCEYCNVTYPAGTNFCPKCGKTTTPVVSTCTKCGTTLMENAKFCHKCGSRVDADTCPNCGKKVTPEERFCSICGTILTDNKEIATTPARVVKQPIVEASLPEKKTAPKE